MILEIVQDLKVYAIFVVFLAFTFLNGTQSGLTFCCKLRDQFD